MVGGSLIWHQAIPAVEQGFLPDVISSDLHKWSINDGMKDMANMLSKFFNLNMSIQNVLYRATWNPAKVIKRTELGNISVGSYTDVAVFFIREDDFGFLDS